LSTTVLPSASDGAQCQHQREVPRDDRGDDADRDALVEGQLAGLAVGQEVAGGGAR
jgi:hypothetical protein